MAMSTYTNIDTKLQEWLNRVGFTDLTDQSEDLILLGQRRIFMTLRVSDMLTVNTSFTVDAQTETVPADFKQLHTVIMNTGGSVPCEIEYADLGDILTLTSTAVPQYVTEAGGSLYFGPPPAASYTATLVYYAVPTLISTTQASNWLSLKYPELILWAAMVEACMFLKDDNRAAVWEAKFQRLFRIIQKEDDDKRKPASGLRVKNQQFSKPGTGNVP